MILPRKKDGANALMVNLYVRREMVNRICASSYQRSSDTDAAGESLKGCA